MTNLWLLLLALAIGAASLAPGGGPPPAAPPQTNAPEPAPPPASRPASITETIELEGMEEPISLRLYEDAALGFTTYIPEWLEAASSSSGEGDGFLATAAFGGVPEPRSAFGLFRPAGTYTRETIAAYAKELQRASGFTVEAYSEDAPPRFPGSVEEFGITKIDEADGFGVIGTVALLERDGRWIIVTIRYLEDHAEGFVPRAMKIYEHLQWH
ncbi:hypothetical protein [Paenibacillus sp.]|uniref:hypothetical protein n=1 Tax=Paenibacillus sp. TaxID=58172 RepID=UPI002D44236F|nr:hypothetical protein [Paenibacillus sp.]HZG57800.1 hypothetical protein [Paenibacillus sp.]